MKITKILMIVGVLFSAGVSQAFQKSYDVKNFDRISIGVPADVVVNIGSGYSVEIDGDDDDLEDVEVKVKDGRLIIRKEGSWGGWMNFDDMDIEITLPKLKGVSLAGSAEIRSNDVIKGDDLTLSVAGSGDIELEIDVKNLKISVAGSGDIELEGTADDLDLSISGSGKVEAENLQVKSVDGKIAGSGKIYISVTESIDASISGSGSIYYKGSPEHVNTRASGSGKVKKM